MKRLVLVLLAACSKFQDENIVIDTRILAMSATVPDQIIDVDLDNPQSDVELLAQLKPTRVCALVADPEVRRLRWSMILCVLSGENLCYSLQSKIGNGIAEDPEETPDIHATEMCGTVNPDGNLLGIIRNAYEFDSFGGLGGIDYGVSFRVAGEELAPVLDIFAGKRLRVAPRIPADRSANTNPDVDHFDMKIDDAEPVPLPLGRCIDQPTKLEVPAKATVRITPIESATTRESYVVPTLDGTVERFTEATTYQWIAGSGSISAGMTGGPHDFAGNAPPLFTDWHAPGPDDVGDGLDVPLWIVQRDERLGVTWYESCLRVKP